MQTRLILGAIIILFGLSLLFQFPLFKVLVAAIIIFIGIKMIRGGEGMSFNLDETSEENEDKLQRVLVFTGVNKKYKSSNFEGGELVTVFGTGKIDLSTVKTKNKEIELNLVAVFGSIDMKLPKNWEVKTEGIGILGAFKNNTAKPKKVSASVFVKGVAVLGEVKLVN